jgi:hypothetical protein
LQPKRSAASIADCVNGLPQLLGTMEGVLRSHRFLQEFLVNRQPPTFAIVTLLLDAPEYSLPTTGFRDLVLRETARLCDAIDSREILARDDQLRVYRRTLYQARGNDLLIDSSEAALLGVLRQELDVSQAEHFLLEHHRDLREFWRQDEAFMRELNALRSAGIVYVRDGKTLLPDDLAPVIRNVLGLDMASAAARRLYGHLSNQDLHEVRIWESPINDRGSVERRRSSYARCAVVARSARSPGDWAIAQIRSPIGSMAGVFQRL